MGRDETTTRAELARINREFAAGRLTAAEAAGAAWRLQEPDRERRRMHRLFVLWAIGIGVVIGLGVYLRWPT